MFSEYLRSINKELAYAQFELRGCRNQYDGKVYYGLVNNVADEQSKLGTKYSVAQIAFYKAIIEAIVQDGSTQGSISNIEALNIHLGSQLVQGSQSIPSCIPATFKNFTMSQKEKTIEDLIRDKWLCSLPAGAIGLGIRSFLDLRGWFQSNGVRSCDVCNEAGITAKLCSNENCLVRIHAYCLGNKFFKAKRICPGCGTTWQCTDFIVKEPSDPDLHTQIAVNASLPSQTEVYARLLSQREVHANLPTEIERLSTGFVKQKRLRNCKEEQVDTVTIDPPTSSFLDLPLAKRRSSRARPV